MQKIEQQVARVAGGEFQPIPLMDRDDELRDLAASINTMCTALAKMTSQLRESERSQLIKQVAAGIAHQLRNALTGARMAVQIHRRRCAHPSDESLDVALRQLALTEEQIRGLVAIVRDEHRIPVAGKLVDLTNEIVMLMKFLCDHRQIELRVVDDSDNAAVSDADAVRAGLLNLCMNAVEAAGTGGKVEIRMSLRESMAVIDVYDNGPGISPELADTVFAPFQTSKPDGMGLGLSLARQAANGLGGTVEYLRRTDGTLFRMTCLCQRHEPDKESGLVANADELDRRPLAISVPSGSKDFR
jgi:signal transduction histidine kinase